MKNVSLRVEEEGKRKEGRAQADEKIGNVLIIGVFVAAIFLYGVYQQRVQGTGPGVGTQKKTI